MGKFQRLAIPILVAAISVPLPADSAKDAYKRGTQAEHKANLDAAFNEYKQAYTLAPRNAKYVSAYLRTRSAASAQHIHTGQILRNTGAVTEAMEQFQRAAEIDSSNFMAQQELRRTADLVRQRERQRTQPRIESPLAKLAEQSGGTVELRPLSEAPITLHMTAQTDVVYKTICRLAGLNVVIDPEFRAQKLTVDLNDVTLREALDIVRLQSKTYWRPLLPNTIFVSVDSTARRKELEANVMKTFYLQNVSAPTDLQEAANVVRQILDLNRVQILQAQDALIVRGTPDQMILAEKLLSDIDKPKAEVIIDVAVMQVSRDRMRNLGTNVPTSASINLNAGALGGAVGGSSSGNSSGGIRLGSFTVSIPGITFTALASDSNTKLIQNPEIRALNNEKATLKIGDRIPIATGSFQPGIVGAGAVSPLVSTQFQYIDVGVTIDITPHIHANNEVTLKMVLEVSSVTGSSTIGGITQPTIGQRRIEHETRLADGDVNLLGGILNDIETQSLSGYPWISKIPLLKYLFAQENKQLQQDELVFAVTPHIIRSQEITPENLRMVEVGTGNLTELRHRSTSSPTAATEHPSEPANAAKPADAAKPTDAAKPQRALPQAAPSNAPAPAPAPAPSTTRPAPPAATPPEPSPPSRP